MSERTIIHEANERENFNSYVQDELPLLYVDGIDRMNLSGPVARMQLFVIETARLPAGANNAATGGVPEERLLIQNLVMPTKSLMAFILNVIRTLKQNEAALMGLYSQEAGTLQKLLNAIKLDDAK